MQFWWTKITMYIDGNTFDVSLKGGQHPRLGIGPVASLGEGIPTGYYPVSIWVFNLFSFLDAGSVDGLLWQQREAKGWIWGILRAVLEEEMGPWNARDHHKYHLPVVLDFWPMLSIIQSLNGPFCCGDSLKIEVNRSIPELTGFSVSCVWLSFWWCGRRRGPMATYG